MDVLRGHYHVITLLVKDLEKLLKHLKTLDEQQNRVRRVKKQLDSLKAQNKETASSRSGGVRGSGGGRMQHTLEATEVAYKIRQSGRELELATAGFACSVSEYGSQVFLLLAKAALNLYHLDSQQALPSTENGTGMHQQIEAGEAALEQRKKEHEEELHEISTRQQEADILLQPEVFEKKSLTFIPPTLPYLLAREMVLHSMTKVLFLTSFQYLPGVLVLTNYRLLFLIYDSGSDATFSPAPAERTLDPKISSSSFRASANSSSSSSSSIVTRVRSKIMDGNQRYGEDGAKAPAAPTIARTSSRLSFRKQTLFPEKGVGKKYGRHRDASGSGMKRMNGGGRSRSNDRAAVDLNRGVDGRGRDDTSPPLKNLSMTQIAFSVPLFSLSDIGLMDHTPKVSSKHQQKSTTQQSVLTLRCKDEQCFALSFMFTPPEEDLAAFYRTLRDRSFQHSPLCYVVAPPSPSRQRLHTSRPEVDLLHSPSIYPLTLGSIFFVCLHVADT